MMTHLEEMILELKDTTDMMVDLAYSSLLYNNVEIAEEVVTLSTSMADLADRIQDSIADVAKTAPEEVSRAVVTTRLLDCILDIAEAAESIARVVVKGLADHPVLAMSIRKSDTTMCLAKVASESVLAGKTLGSVSLSTNSGMFVIAIRRDRDYIFGPGPDTRIEADDILMARGPGEAVSYFKDLADGTERSISQRSDCLREGPACIRSGDA